MLNLWCSECDQEVITQESPDQTFVSYKCACGCVAVNLTDQDKLPDGWEIIEPDDETPEYGDEQYEDE